MLRVKNVSSRKCGLFCYCCVSVKDFGSEICAEPPLSKKKYTISGKVRYLDAFTKLLKMAFSHVMSVRLSVHRYEKNLGPYGRPMDFNLLAPEFYI